MTHVAFTAEDTAPAGARPMAQARYRRGLFIAFALFILLGPAPGQLFGNHSPWLREWVMYSGVGIGIPKGVFTVQDGTNPSLEYSPLQAAGLEQYPRIAHYTFDRRVFDVSDLSRFAAPLCADMSADQRVSFSGYVGTRRGWVPVLANDLCQTDGARP